MKKEEFYEMLGDLDENAVKSAETPPARRAKTRRIGYGVSAAAFLGLIVGISIWIYHSNSPAPDNTSSINETSSEAAIDIDIEQDNINIFYLEGDTIKSVSEFLPCDPKIVFDSWRSHNGIGDEVRLIEVKIENNGTEKVDSLVAGYTAGDKFTLNVRITENLKKYYETRSEEKLLRSLKQTLTGYSNIEFDEFNLILE
ncbi:MAG: hypothetical protein IKN66_03170 [Ruminococcus sp.]|nr:hypothetical protein [Ruminococcus sp.]